MAEITKQLTKEIRCPRAPVPLIPKRYVSVTDYRAKIDRALQITQLLDSHYLTAQKVVLVMENLSTHTGGSLFEAFPPHDSTALMDLLELHYTPKAWQLSQYR